MRRNPSLRRLTTAVAGDDALDLVDPLIEELGRRRPERRALHDHGAGWRPRPRTVAP